MSDDDLTIIVGDGGTSISGWEDITVTLRAEAFPNEFELKASASDPVTMGAIVAKAGDACQIMIGGDLVITGFIDRDTPSGDARSHQISLVGRGKTQDLVDCSAEFASSAIMNATALDIATKLAGAYPGLSVRMADGVDPGPRVDQILVNYGETGADIIQRVARNAGLLAYEGTDGALILGQAGKTVASSGVVYGQNVQAYAVQNSMDDRFSEVICTILTIDLFGDIASFNDKANFFHTESDPNVPRHRRLYISFEQAPDPYAFTASKTKWEIARRAGRSTMVQVTVDSWRDQAGTLWLPNTLVPVDVPGLRIPDKNLCISQVTFKRNSETGTTAELVLLPPAAFTPEPIVLVPVNTLDITAPDTTV